MKKQYVEIEISTIKARTPLLRDSLGDLATLEASVRKFGLLNPLVIDADNILIAGARRLEACKRAGLTRVPVLKVDAAFGTMQALDIQTDENLCREALTPSELTRHIQEKKLSLHTRLPRWIRSLVAAVQRFFTRHRKPA